MSQTSGRSKTGSVRFKVKEHLLIPFGCPKWDISKIKITGVSTEATYFESETPCVYIDKTERKALTLENVPNVFPVEPGGFPTQLDSLGQYEYIKEFLKKYTDPKTEFENLFLDIYFQHFKEAHRDPHWFSWRNKIKNPDKLVLSHVEIEG